jgi:hypothetical protein
MDQLDTIRDWLRAHNPAAGDIELDLDLDLIDNRVIDSLGFTEFLLFIEGLVDREITLDLDSAVALRTLRGISEGILEVPR